MLEGQGTLRPMLLPCTTYWKANIRIMVRVRVRARVRAWVRVTVLG